MITSSSENSIIGMRSTEYSQVSSYDLDENLVEEEKPGNDVFKEDLDNAESNQVLVRNTKSVPLSKPPSKGRDKFYLTTFLLHFWGVLIVAYIFEQKFMSNTIILYRDAGSWASILMIATLLGSIFGIVLCAILSSMSSKLMVLSISVPFTTALQICLGNIVLLLGDNWWFLSCILLMGACIDFKWYKQAQENIIFTSTLIEITFEIFNKFGIYLYFVSIMIIAAHTFSLLWWGAILVGSVSEVEEIQAFILLLLLLFSFYWITQFFHCILSMVVGGCVMWYFITGDNQQHITSSDHIRSNQSPTILGNETPTMNMNRRHTNQIDPPITQSYTRVLLYARCAFSSSMGSAAKGALWCPISQAIISVMHWARYELCHNSFLRGLIRFFIQPLEITAKRHSRLSLCHIATYGRTLCKSSEELSTHQDIIKIANEDLTSFHMKTIASATAGVIAVLMAIIGERKEGSSWPVFLLLCYYLAYMAISLPLHAFRSAVDALVIAYAYYPENFSKLCPIIFLRFFRMTELMSVETAIS